tara:strand:- start:4677 stop:5126 length:450 start_codon:yes stop_codon:yes gene_type:complete
MVQIHPRASFLKENLMNTHGEHQMSLGAIIKAISKYDIHLPVYLDTAAKESPGTPHSYKDYAKDLAFEPTTNIVLAGDFVSVLASCVDKSFMGFEDSDGFYADKIMRINTPCWISRMDIASNLGITDVLHNGTNILIITKLMPEEVSDA